jgi:hypothetical protein
MTLGFDKQLYILPFDQRGTFQSAMFGWAGSCCRGRRSRGRIGDFWRQRSGIRRHTRLQAAVR